MVRRDTASQRPSGFFTYHGISVCNSASKLLKIQCLCHWLAPCMPRPQSRDTDQVRLMDVWTRNSLGIVVLLLAPAVLGWAIGYTDVAHHAALGVVLALNMCLLARRIQHFS